MIKRKIYARAFALVYHCSASAFRMMLRQNKKVNVKNLRKIIFAEFDKSGL